MNKIAAITLSLLLFVSGAVLGDVLLTIPEAVRSEIGGTGTVNYDKIRTISIEVRPGDNTVVARIEIFASSDAAQPAYAGTYTLDATASTAKLEIPGLGFQTGLTLSGAQATSVIDSIDAHRDNVEDSMISFGVVDGTQQ